MSKYLILFPCFLYPLLFTATSQTAIDDLTENVMIDAMDGEEENTETTLENYEEIISLFSDKININRVSEEDLKRLPIITDFQIHSFIKYRSKYGKIYSEKELSLISGFHPDLISAFSMLFDFGNINCIKVFSR